MAAAKSLTYKGSILDPKNLNLIVLQKEFIKAHDKMSHVAMQ